MRAYFEYDYLGRRASQYVESYDTGTQTWTVVAYAKYIWSGWLMLMELDGLSSDAVLRRNTWGLDLAGQAGNVNSLEAAGGIGDLLAVSQSRGDTGDYLFTYDANGNVAQVLDRTATTVNDALVAHYEYDPYGNVINDLSGYAYAEANRWRFSTKQFDAATGLGYWGYRYYDPVLGRWLSRDPIGEGSFSYWSIAMGRAIPRGGADQARWTGGPESRTDIWVLYRAFHNTPTSRIDPIGLRCSAAATRITTTYGEQCGMCGHRLCRQCSYCVCGCHYSIYAEPCGTCVGPWSTAPGPPPCGPPPRQPLKNCCNFMKTRKISDCKDCCISITGPPYPPGWEVFVQECISACNSL